MLHELQRLACKRGTKVIWTQNSGRDNDDRLQAAIDSLLDFDLAKRLGAIVWRQSRILNKRAILIQDLIEWLWLTRVCGADVYQTLHPAAQTGVYHVARANHIDAIHILPAIHAHRNKACQ